MEEVIKVAHLGSEMEGAMLVDRLAQNGIHAYIKQTKPAKSRLYSGGLTAQLGVDVYVHQNNREKAMEFIKEWNTVVTDSKEISEEAVSASEIADDVKEYLEEEKTENTLSSDDTIAGGGIRRKVAQIIAILLLLAGLALVIYTILTNLGLM